MPRSRNQNTRLPKLVHRLGRRNLAVVAAFVLVFAGVGAFYVQRSQADTGAGYCVFYKLYEYRSGFYGSHCVKDVQFALNRLSINSGYPDGIFGPQTRAAVLQFGNLAGIPGGNSGQVGVRTWKAFCVRSYNYPSVARDMGCDKQNAVQYWGSL